MMLMTTGTLEERGEVLRSVATTVKWMSPVLTSADASITLPVDAEMLNSALASLMEYWMAPLGPISASLAVTVRMVSPTLVLVVTATL